MFRIRKVYDDVSPANRHTLAQVANIMRSQFPLASQEEIDKLPGQLRDRLKFGFRSVVFVAEDARDRRGGRRRLQPRPAAPGDLHCRALSQEAGKGAAAGA